MERRKEKMEKRRVTHSDKEKQQEIRNPKVLREGTTRKTNGRTQRRGERERRVRQKEQRNLWQ